MQNQLVIKLAQSALLAAGVGVSSLAWAGPDDAPPDGADTTETAAEPPREAAKTPAPPAEKQAETAPTATENPSIVERLPASAFPDWTTRGIPGGSLAGTFHGMPWPYYPKTGLGVSGSVWVDLGYETIKRGNPSQQGQNSLVSQGRGVLRFTPTYTRGDWYAQAQAELIANGDQSKTQPAVASTDDLWVRGGQLKSWDVQAGRFEAFEVYHFGLGMDLNTYEREGAKDTTRPATDVPGLADYVYRQSGMNNVALHKYFGNTLRFELLGQFGQDAASTLVGYGARPAAVLDLGIIKVKAAADVRKLYGQSPVGKELRTQRGGSGAVQLVIDPYFELGVNAAVELIDHWAPQNTSNSSADRGDYDALGSTTTTAFGGFANVRVFDGLVAGAGVNFITQTDQVQGKFTNMPAFAALQYKVNGQLYLKAVCGYDKFVIDPGNLDPWTNTMLSGRFRVLYLF